MSTAESIISPSSVSGLSSMAGSSSSSGTGILTSSSSSTSSSSGSSSSDGLSVEVLLATIKSAVESQVASILASSVPSSTSSPAVPSLTPPGSSSSGPPSTTLSGTTTSGLASLPIFSLGSAIPPTMSADIPIPGPSSSSLPAPTMGLSWGSPLMRPPEGGTSISKPGALLLSSALPPIPGKLVEKIQLNNNIDMKELLPDNIALRKRLEEVSSSGATHCSGSASSSRLRDISDPLSWVFCFLSFVAAKIDHQDTRDMLAYGQIIIELARKHAGLGWYTYDSLFRQQRNAGAGLKWTELNASLMAATVLGSRGAAEGGKICSLCMASDHLAYECALSSLDHQHKLHSVPPRGSSDSSSSGPMKSSKRSATGYSAPYPKPPPSAGNSSEPCRRYNRGICVSRPCKYEHWCNYCFRGPHSALECPKRPDIPTPTKDGGKSSEVPPKSGATKY